MVSGEDTDRTDQKPRTAEKYGIRAILRPLRLLLLVREQQVLTL